MSIATQTMDSPSRKQKIVAVLVVILAIVIIFSFLKAAKPEAPEPNLTEQLTRVNTSTLSVSQAAPSFKTIGRITASAMSEMKSQVTGTVTAVHVEAGQQVSQGDILIEVDPKEQSRLALQAQTQLVMAESNLNQAIIQHKANIQLLDKDQQLSVLAARSLKRYRDLLKRKLATEAQVDQANEIAQRQAASTIQRKTAVDNWPTQKALLESQQLTAAANFAQAEEDLKSTQLTAPFNGTVASVMVAPASRVAPGMNLVSLYDQKQLIVEASIPQSAMRTLESQKTSESTPKISARGKVWGKEILFRLKALSQTQGSGGGTIGLFTPIGLTQPLPVNRAFEATIEMPLLTKAYDIPVVALHSHQYIYRLSDDNHLQRQDVKILGETYVNDERRYLIAATDIPEGSQYVTSQMTKNVNGMKVEPAGANSSTTSPTPEQSSL